MACCPTSLCKRLNTENAGTVGEFVDEDDPVAVKSEIRYSLIEEKTEGDAGPFCFGGCREEGQVNVCD